MPETPTTPTITVQREAVQFTPGQEPVLVWFRNPDPAGLFASSTLHHTRQETLIALMPDALRDSGRWGDPELDADLLAWLAANGIVATIAEATP